MRMRLLSFIAKQHCQLRFAAQLFVVLISFFTRYYPTYHGQSSWCFLAYLTHWSNSTLLILNVLQLSPKFQRNTNTTQFTISLSVFILLAWLLLVVPFNPRTLRHVVSWIEHLLPFLLQSSLLLFSPPKPPQRHYVVVGVSYLLAYLIWTIIFDMLGLNLHKRNYIYAVLSWRYAPLKSTAFSMIALGLYVLVYFGVQQLTKRTIRIKTERDFELVRCRDSKDYNVEHNPAVIRLESSSSSLEDDLNHFQII